MHRPVGMYPTAFGKPPPPSELGPLNNMILRGPPIIVTPAMQTSAHMDNVVSTSILSLAPVEHACYKSWRSFLTFHCYASESTSLFNIYLLYLCI